MNYKILEQYTEPPIIREKIDTRTRRCMRHTPADEAEIRANLDFGWEIIKFVLFIALLTWMFSATLPHIIESSINFINFISTK